MNEASWKPNILILGEKKALLQKSSVLDQPGPASK